MFVSNKTLAVSVSGTAATITVPTVRDVSLNGPTKPVLGNFIRIKNAGSSTNIIYVTVDGSTASASNYAVAVPAGVETVIATPVNGSLSVFGSAAFAAAIDIGKVI